MNKLFLVILLFAFLCSHGQQTINCGPVKLDSAAERRASDYQRSHARPQYASPIMIPVYFHIVGNVQGTEYAATPAQIAQEFNDLVSAYSSNNICFYNAGYDYINSSKLDTNFRAGVDPASLFDPYRVAKCLNIFYIRKIKGNNVSCPGGCGFGGVTLAVPNTFCLVSSGNIGFANTIAHEVGHCFGLLHTFNDGNGYENIDRSNGTTSADMVADTNADPYDYDSTCNNSTSCVYSGTCTDPNGHSNFSPPYLNLMSYWGGCYNNLVFTSGQFTRAESFINTDPGLVAIVAGNSNYTMTGLNLSSGKNVYAANANVVSSGSVFISGSAQVSCGAGNAVILNENFIARPGTGGFVLIGVRKCN